MTNHKHSDLAPVIQETRGLGVIFIHSSLDDAGLTPQEFRVFAHLSRRAGCGLAFAGAESMAAVCRMHADTVWKALAELERRRMVTRERRKGLTTIFRLTPPGDWDLNIPETEGHPLKPDTRNGGVTPTPPNREDLPGSKGHEGNPQRKSQEGNPKRPRVELPEGLNTEAFAELWNEWRDHRKALRHPMTPQHEARELKRLAGWGETRAIAAVTQSLEKGWRGIFEPEARPTPSAPAAPAVPAWRRLRDLQDEEAKLTASLPTVFDRERHPDKVKRLAVVRAEIKALNGGSQ